MSTFLLTVAGPLRTSVHHLPESPSVCGLVTKGNISTAILRRADRWACLSKPFISRTSSLISSALRMLEKVDFGHTFRMQFRPRELRPLRLTHFHIRL